jgi:SAM-dependent methyltransferase
MGQKQHWEEIYATRQDADVSWTEPDPHRSLSLVRQVCSSGSVIDVGGGTSVLCERLLDAGYSVAVLDISANALGRARARLGARAEKVRWIVADVTTNPDIGTYDVWHDRAVFHFLIEPSDRAAYISLLTRCLPVGGHVIIATFALDGPEKCSGLPVRRYDGQTLASELGAGFKLILDQAETHMTPWGKPQAFNYAVFVRTEPTIEN